MALPSLSTWRKFTVRTLDADGLSAAARELAGKAAGFAPDLLVGIRTGGYIVAELMAPHLKAKLLPITSQRPSTHTKQNSSVIKTALKQLPYALLNPLRIGEHIALTQLREPKLKIFIPNEAELKAIQAAQGKKILIIDDSLDTGATLSGVVDAVRAVAPNAEIKTAVITFTTETPLIQPDYPLYRYVLCRFPWSLDFKR